VQPTTITQSATRQIATLKSKLFPENEILCNNSYINYGNRKVALSEPNNPGENAEMRNIRYS